jgi:poly(hydroxyalkanoate) granule-associated protein
MVTKPKAAAADENALTGALLDLVCGSAHRIWQAGLGAFAQARNEGSDLFDKLAQDGVALHQATQRLAGERDVSIADAVSRFAADAGKLPGGSWDKLEKVFEDRVARSLDKLDVPSRQELVALRGEIAQLRSELQAAIAALPPAKRAKPAAARRA